MLINIAGMIGTMRKHAKEQKVHVDNQNGTDQLFYVTDCMETTRNYLPNIKDFSIFP